MHGCLGLAVSHEDRRVEVVQHRTALRDANSLRDGVNALRGREDKTILTANGSQLRRKLRTYHQWEFVEDYACEWRRLPPLLDGIKKQLCRQPKEEPSEFRFGHGVD
jgi:hypothetical protein